MSSDFLGYLKPNVIAEPLVSQWYAWSYLIPPATAARYLTESQLKIMQSFVDAPEVHVSALRDPAMQGGPFINYPAERAGEIKMLLEKTQQEQTRLFGLSGAIASLNTQLSKHPPGHSLEPLYAQLPEALKGYVELVYDDNNCPTIRFIEGLLYRSEYYDAARQSIALRVYDDIDQRPFVMSTPRLPDQNSLFLPIPFDDACLDELFRMRHQSASVQFMAERLEVPVDRREFFLSLFTPSAPRPAQPHQGDGVRIRYLGHACVLIETAEVSILCDPLVSYEHPTGMTRYSYADLPETIDYALITHNHQDHVMLETLLQLRHKIRQVVIPTGQKGALLDPSLKLALEQIGFPHVRTQEEMESIPLPDGEMISIPVLGEHGDLNIATKTAYWITLKGNSILCAADSNNLDPGLYQNIHHLLGDLDVLFIGMECDGAPFTWAYGPILSQSVSHQQAQTRRLDGSNAERAAALVDQLNPQQVYVYAMGQEPWLTYITSIHYTPESAPIKESNRLVELCRQQNRISERLLGRKEIELAPGKGSQRMHRPIPVSDAVSVSALDVKPPPTAVAYRSAPSAMPTTDELTRLLDQLQSRDVRLWLDGDTLRCNAPKGALTPKLTAQLKEHKPAIIALLKGSAAPTPAAKTADPTPTSNSLSQPDWQQDIILPADISPSPLLPFSPSPQNVLLTGATGFLGAFLLRELLEQTNVTIHCLLRVTDAADGLARLEKCLSDYNLWHPHYAARLVAIPGDLSQPHLGLSKAQFDTLAEQIDSIYHNGAHVHHISPYAQLRAANVLGTREIIRFACHGRTAPLHYTSTLSVLPPRPLPGRTEIYEQDDLNDYPVPVGGYNRSKWVAEQLVTQGRDRMLPVTIYRPGPISGDSQTGVFNSNDLLYRLMQGYVQSGMAPDGKMPLDMLPVDYVARAMVYLSLRPESAGKAFHLIHPQPASSDLLFEACQSAGYAVERVPYATWFEKLTHIAQGEQGHALYPLVSLFSSRRGEAEEATISEVPFDTQQMVEGLADAPFDLPPLDLSLFKTYLRAMVQSGALPPPAPT